MIEAMRTFGDDSVCNRANAFRFANDHNSRHVPGVYVVDETDFTEQHGSQFLMSKHRVIGGIQSYQLTLLHLKHRH